MGNTGSSLSRAAGQQARRKLPSAPQPGEQDLTARIAAHEQARAQELPSVEQLHSKDMPLDEMLSRISSAIQPRALDITKGQVPQDQQQQQQHVKGDSSQPRAAAAQGAGPAAPPVVPPHLAQHRLQGTAVMMSAKDRRQPIPEYRPSGLSVEQLAQLQGKLSAASRQGQVDDGEPGRVEAYVLREVLEAKNAAEAQGTPVDLTPFTQAYGANASKLEALFKHCAIPLVGKVKTFGHEYGFARPPAWWIPPKEQSFGAMFRSEAAVLQASAARRQPAPEQAGPHPGGMEDTEAGQAAAGKTPALVKEAAA